MAGHRRADRESLLGGHGLGWGRGCDQEAQWTGWRLGSVADKGGVGSPLKPGRLRCSADCAINDYYLNGCTVYNEPQRLRIDAEEENWQ